MPKEFDFGPYEILLSDHKDTIRVECLMGFAEVEENCKNCKDIPYWCWNMRYRALEGKIIPNNSSGKEAKGENLKCEK